MNQDMMRSHVSNKTTLIAIVFLLVLSTSSADNNRTSEGTVWRRAGRMTGLLLDSCFRSLAPGATPEEMMAILSNCFATRSLAALRRVLEGDVVGIWDGVEFVRDRREEGNYTRSDRYLGKRRRNEPFDEEVDWKTNVIQGVERLLRTHVLKIHLKKFDGVLEEARGRRKNMFNQMLMFGVIVASLIVIPMGFQFLAILGGKALLLSKMALILASIQGLKKIATSNLNYGLYSYGPGGPWNYDRQWQQDGYGLQNYGNVEGYADALHPRKDLLHDIQTR
ncbi:unnamed protein product [Phaedon cochleariae]|uniref:Uncharacterized protein n=1 Tax=Phaedon cochleariae TaxID=80249 RepID=A0A9P0GVX5_PHACE|nr:unnamed protein product [Phaedon cochleariae]